MKNSEIRDNLIKQLNSGLDNDHNLIECMLLTPKHVSVAEGQSGLFDGKINALLMICEFLDIEPIHPFYEGELVQRFE